MPSNRHFSDKEILNYHRPKILSNLWSEGWDAIAEPVIKKHSATKYTIFVKAHIRRGMTGRPAFTINEKPMTINEVLKNKK